MVDYIRQIYKARHLLYHLSLYDLNQKYRRSFLGILWAILQPLGMALLLALVLGSVFEMEVSEYVPYIFSGLIFWEFVSSSAVGGCQVFRFSQYYIRQCTLPSMIYTLRHSLGGMINFVLALLGLILWVLVAMPQNFGITWLTLLPATVLLFLCLWPMATISAYIATWFYDFSQLVGLALQALFFVSPVFLKPQVFLESKYGLGFLVHYNPVFHGLELFRAPLLHGSWPAPESVLFSLATCMALWAIASVMVWRGERTLIFHY
ncbi:MAG: ABC transporter permease [Nitratireductor sp.]|nr:ABC transporter permease [Nitratireductor sp.]